MLVKYKNGNANIELYNDGTRIINYDNKLELEYPLNIDIRVSTKCSFGQRSNGTYVLCNFCHESAKTDGSECDYSKLKLVLKDLPPGIELAIGANELTNDLISFLRWCQHGRLICNLTINQGHIWRDYNKIKFCLGQKLIKGLGISYRSGLKFNIPKDIINYSNTVIHVIAGIDTFKEVDELVSKGVKKILVLGEKDFGFNSSKVDLNSNNHRQWFWWVSKLFNKFEVVSFDNLALEQLNIKRFFNNNDWEIFNQGEYSFYINAVEGYFSPSSRNNNKTKWENTTIKQYFKDNIYI
mgnify:CR=1 FL=1